MADYGQRITDGAVSSSARKIRAVYRQAEKELNRKLLSFRKRFAAQQKFMSAALKAGEISKAEYESWMRGQVFRGQRWEAKINQLVRLIHKTNLVANKIIQRFRLFVFGENYNHNAYETEINTGISFDIYNEDAVEKLLKEDPKMLPEWRIDEEKDYIWNRQKVENAITQGIIQGESVDQIAERLANVLSSTNMSKMRMFARTAMTGAQNAGRQKQMEDAIARGIKVKKQWLATLDTRTRDTHQRLDGQLVAVDESFKVSTKTGTEQIRYPGDPSAPPALVYNCRCTMKQVIEGTEHFKRTRRAYDEPDENGRRNSYTVEDMTYPEWVEWKRRNGKK